MREIFITILTFAYGIGGIIIFLGFLPTIRDLWQGKPSANISTYLIWTITTLLTSLYGFFVLDNWLFNVVINLQLLACLIILVLRLRLKNIEKPKLWELGLLLIGTFLLDKFDPKNYLWLLPKQK